jgi:hypothetical protein
MFGIISGMTAFAMMTAVILFYTGLMTDMTQLHGFQSESRRLQNERLEMMQYLKSEQRCSELVNHLYSDGSVKSGIDLPNSLKDKEIFFSVEPHQGTDDAVGSIVVKNDSGRTTKVAVHFKGLNTVRTCSSVIIVHKHSDEPG